MITRFSYACRSGGAPAKLHIKHEEGKTLCGKQITKLWRICHRKASDTLCARCVRKDLNQ